MLDTAARLAATTLHVVVAVLIAGSAGFVGGKLDLLVQRFVDALDHHRQASSWRRLPECEKGSLRLVIKLELDPRLRGSVGRV